jgi:hypothetical protein
MCDTCRATGTESAVVGRLADSDNYYGLGRENIFHLMSFPPLRPVKVFLT